MHDQAFSTVELEKLYMKQVVQHLVTIALAHHPTSILKPFLFL